MESHVAIRIASWNINGGKLTQLLSDDASHVNPEKYIGEQIKRANVDVACLQEVSFFDEEENKFISRISEASGLPYFEYFCVSRSHIFENAGLGLAILSRYKIENFSCIELLNPKGLYLIDKKGEKIKSHEKAFVKAEVEVNGSRISIANGHLTPFWLFNRQGTETMFRDLHIQIYEIFNSLESQPAIICADMNVENITESFPYISKMYDFVPTIVCETKKSNNVGHVRGDQIFLSKYLNKFHSKALWTRSDHHMCLTEVFYDRNQNLKEEKFEDSEDFLSSNDVLTLFHFSDVHFGRGTRQESDVKNKFKNLPISTSNLNIVEVIRNLKIKPDYVIFSGDITIRGEKEGFDEFDKFIDIMIDENLFPSAKNIITCPGNHDVKKINYSDNTLLGEMDRWQGYLSLINSVCIRPWFQEKDGESKNVIARFKDYIKKNRGNSIIGGTVSTPDEKRGINQYIHYPILMDRQKKVVIFTFNSSSSSNTYLELPGNIVDSVKEIKSGCSEENRKKIDYILDSITGVDPARISPSELELFCSLATILKNEFEDDYRSSLKVAVLHHHVAPIYSEEIKQFEQITNAALFKQRLCQMGFQIVLHGHKHERGIYRDTAIKGSGELVILSGGTTGGYSDKDSNGFYIIQRKGTLDSLEISFVNISDFRHLSNAVLEKALIDIYSKERIVKNSDFTEDKVVKKITTNPMTLFENCTSAVYKLAQKNENNGSMQTGWNKFFEDNRTITPLATAYVLRSLKRIETDSFHVRELMYEAAQTVLSLKSKDGGYCTSGYGNVGLPIETATVLHALCGLASKEQLEDLSNSLILMLTSDKYSEVLSSIYALCIIADAFIAYGGNMAFLRKVVRAIECTGIRGESGKIKYWSRNVLPCSTEEIGIDDNNQPSPVHTAYALSTLMNAYRAFKFDKKHMSEDLLECANWLLLQNWKPVSERIVQSQEIGIEFLVNHYVAPVAIEALLNVGIAPENQKIRAEFIDICNLQNDGLWGLENIKCSVWATLDALKAISAYSKASRII